MPIVVVPRCRSGGRRHAGMRCGMSSLNYVSDHAEVGTYYCHLLVGQVRPGHGVVDVGFKFTLHACPRRCQGLLD